MKKNKQNENPKGWLHGECVLKQVSLPAGCQIQTDLKLASDGGVIIADSETTGNHHVIDRVPGVDFYTNGNQRYVVSTVPFNVRCVLKERHDTFNLSPGSYEISFQQEYDYLTQSLRNVRD